MRWRGSGHDRAFVRETELALLNAPFARDGWRSAIDKLARATWSRGANLVCLGGDVPSLNLITGFDQHQVDTVFNDPVMWGKHNWRVGTTTHPYAIQHDLHYRDYRARVPRGDYDEAAFELDMVHGCQTIFSQDAAGFIGIAVLRSHDDGPTCPDAVDRFEYLSSVMARALKLEMAMAGEGIHLALGRVDKVGVPVFLINRHGWACGMSGPAEALLEHGFPVRRVGPGLAIGSAADNHRFQQLLGFMLGERHGPGQAVALTIGGGDRPTWKLSIAHLPTSDLTLGFDPHVMVRVEPVAAQTFPLIKPN